MSAAKNIAGVIPGVMALGLVGEVMKNIPSEKDLGKKGLNKKGFEPNKQIKSSMKILVGVPLIGAVAGQVNKLP